MYYQAAFVTLFVFIASFMLSVLISLSYLTSKKKSVIFWGTGMWLFALASLLEVFFATGFVNIPLIDSYLFLVALLVQLLSVGSLLLIGRRILKLVYGVYAIATDAFLLFALYTNNPGNIITNGVVFGNLPVSVTVGSILITVPAAAILLVISALSYLKKRDWKQPSIISGTIVLSAAGALYISFMPSFLYLAELFGIVLLWFGFVDFDRIPVFAGVRKHVHG